MENFHRLISICFILIAIGVNFTSAICNGFSVELEKAENCAVDGTVAYTLGTDSTAFMTDDCDMVVRICGDTIGYSTNVVKTSIQRNGNKFYKGKQDFCEILEYHQSDRFASIKINGEQAMCPFKAGPMCTDYMFGTGKFQGMIQLMVGKYDMKFEATYDTGKSCSHSVVNVKYTKPPRK